MDEARAKPVINEELAQRAAGVLKAVAHPMRLQIVHLLAEGELCVGDIVVALGTKASITSQQLNMMKDKGVLACRRDGARVYYRVANPHALEVLACVFHHCRESVEGESVGVESRGLGKSGEQATA